LIPDDAIGIFHWHDPSDRTMALGSTQPLTEMSTRRISWEVKAAGAYGWQTYHLPVPLSWNLVTLTSWNPLDHSRPVTGLLYLHFYRDVNETCALLGILRRVEQNFWPFKMWPLGCPETSVLNHHYVLRNIRKERR